jgi:hypothetical protein
VIVQVLEKAAASVEDGAERGTFLHHLKNVVRRSFQELVRNKADHTIVNRDLQRIGHVSEHGNAVVADSVVQRASLANRGILERPNDIGKTLDTQMKHGILGDLINVLLLGVKGNLLHGSTTVTRLGVEHHRRTRVASLWGSQTSKVGAVDDQVHVVVRLGALAVVGLNQAASVNLFEMTVAAVVLLTSALRIPVCDTLGYFDSLLVINLNGVAAIPVLILSVPRAACALAVFVAGSKLARLTFEVANVNFLLRASAITQGSRASRLRDQFARALEAAGNTHSVVEVEVSLARLTHVVADRDLMGRACAVDLAGWTGLERDQFARALEAVSVACDGKLRANVRAQVGHTRSWDTCGLNGDVKTCARRCKLGATSSAGGSRNVVRSLTRDFATTGKASSPIQALGCDGVAGLAQDVVAAIRIERV